MTSGPSPAGPRRFPIAGLGLVAGAATGLLLAVVLDLGLTAIALAVPVGAGPGLVVGAAVAALRTPTGR
jgi:hypothetical protein